MSVLKGEATEYQNGLSVGGRQVPRLYGLGNGTVGIAKVLGNCPEAGLEGEARNGSSAHLWVCQEISYAMDLDLTSHYPFCKLENHLLKFLADWEISSTIHLHPKYSIIIRF